MIYTQKKGFNIPPNFSVVLRNYLGLFILFLFIGLYLFFRILNVIVQSGEQIALFFLMLFLGLVVYIVTLVILGIVFMKKSFSRVPYSQNESIELTDTHILVKDSKIERAYDFSHVDHLSFLNTTFMGIKSLFFQEFIRKNGVYRVTLDNKEEIIIPASYEQRDVLIQEIINKSHLSKMSTEGEKKLFEHNKTKLSDLQEYNGKILWVKGEVKVPYDTSLDIYSVSKGTNLVRILLILSLLIVLFFLIVN